MLHLLFHAPDTLLSQLLQFLVRISATVALGEWQPEGASGSRRLFLAVVDFMDKPMESNAIGRAAVWLEDEANPLAPVWSIWFGFATPALGWGVVG